MFDCRFGFYVKFPPRSRLEMSRIRDLGSNMYFCQNLVFLVFPLLLAVSNVPGGFKKLREACRHNFHLVSSKSEAVGPSYDQRTEKSNEYQINEYQILSVKGFKPYFE